MPSSTSGRPICCPLNYFQESCSIPEKWILNDINEKIHLTNIDKLIRVVITKKNNGTEELVKISDSISVKLFEYFKMDVNHNPFKFKGFDCYAFQSLLGNVKFFPPDPSWDYKSNKPQLGDCIVLTKGNNLPEAIKHWAIYLGDDLYLSKFGREGEGADAQVTVMNLEGMKLLYDCKNVYTAYRKIGAEPWNGYITQ